MPRRGNSPRVNPLASEVREFAQGVRGLGETPEEIVENWSIEVVYRSLAADFKGIYYGHDRSIYINSDLEPLRQRRTLAHELGHYILDAYTGTSTLSSSTYMPQFQDHVFEDYFAAELILPINKLEASDRSAWVDIARQQEAHDSVLALQARQLTPDVYMVSYGDKEEYACVGCAFHSHKSKTCNFSPEEYAIRLEDLLIDQLELDLGSVD